MNTPASIATALVATFVTAGSAGARCGPGEHPHEGTAVSAPCDQRSASPREQALRAQDGFVDLGNGTRVRISGRVRGEATVRSRAGSEP